MAATAVWPEPLSEESIRQAIHTLAHQLKRAHQPRMIGGGRLSVPECVSAVRAWQQLSDWAALRIFGSRCKASDVRNAVRDSAATDDDKLPARRCDYCMIAKDREVLFNVQSAAVSILTSPMSARALLGLMATATRRAMLWLAYAGALEAQSSAQRGYVCGRRHD